MDLLKAVSIIGKDLEEAIALLDQLSSVPGSHIAETELARSRVRSASDLLRLLPSLAGAPEPQERQEIKSNIVKEVGTEVKAENIISPSQPAQPDKPMIESDRQPGATDSMVETPEPESPAINETEGETARGPVKQNAETHKNHEHLKSILADRFSTSGTLGEKISSERHDEVISSVMHSKPIADIAAAIGMNDKFFFIRELFSGDVIAYNTTVTRLNAAASLGEAMKILDESTVMGSDPAAQSSFVDVVRRKFSINV